MVVTAEQQSVVEIGGATLRPRNDVVRIRESRWTRAPGEAAAAVADGQSPTLSRREEPLTATEIKRYAVGTEHQAGNGSITAEPLRGLRCQWKTLTR
jgi:hypothetical protein